LTICSDIGGYFAGITLGRGGRAQDGACHQPEEDVGGPWRVSPDRHRAGVILVPVLLHGSWWQGAIIGVAAVAAGRAR